MKPLSQTRQALVEEFGNKFSSVTFGGEEWRKDKRPEDVYKWLDNALDQILSQRTTEIVGLIEGIKVEETGEVHTLNWNGAANQAVQAIKNKYGVK